MKLANNLKISVFAKLEEDAESIENKLLELIPFNLEKEKIIIEKQTALGFNQKQIKTFEITLKKDRHINAFLTNLIKNLTKETKQLILKQAESRLDKELNFFLRFDKTKLLEENKLQLTDKGECFHIKINIAAFPKKREKALEIISNLFK